MHSKVILYLSLIFIQTFTNCDRKFQWLTIGDSITQQDGKAYLAGVHKGNKAIGYQTIIGKQIDSLRIFNEGYRGLTLTAGKRSLFPKVINLDFEKFDLVSIFCGTNDFKLNMEIGDLNNQNLDKTTFFGAYNSLIQKIKQKKPSVQIVLITPLQRNKDNYSSFTQNTKNYKLDDYVNAIYAIGLLHDLKIVDLYNDPDFTFERLDELTYDGLHPNDLGYKIIGERILDEVFKD